MPPLTAEDIIAMLLPMAERGAIDSGHLHQSGDSPCDALCMDEATDQTTLQIARKFLKDQS